MNTKISAALPGTEMAEEDEGEVEEGLEVRTSENLILMKSYIGEDFMVHRRNEREMISFKGSERVWGRSPDRGFDSDVDSEPEAMEVGDAKEKKKKKSKKSKKKKSKKSKKKKKKKSSSSDSSDSDDEDCWVEKDVMLSVAERRAKEVILVNFFPFFLVDICGREKSKREFGQISLISSVQLLLLLLRMNRKKSK